MGEHSSVHLSQTHRRAGGPRGRPSQSPRGSQQRRRHIWRPPQGHRTSLGEKPPMCDVTGAETPGAAAPVREGGGGAWRRRGKLTGSNVRVTPRLADGREAAREEREEPKKTPRLRSEHLRRVSAFLKRQVQWDERPCRGRGHWLPSRGVPSACGRLRLQAGTAGWCDALFLHFLLRFSGLCRRRLGAGR